MSSSTKSSSVKNTKRPTRARRRKSSIVKTHSPDELIKFYKDMLKIRRFEENAGQMYGLGLIGGFCHLYIGQEAVGTGIQAALKSQDTVITTYRDHGHMLACGMEPRGVMAELTGRAGGYSAGKGGSMHMFSAEKNFYGGHGIVGANVPLGTGIAFAHKYQKDNGVCLTYFGDGAVNQGQVYEAFNMAALWKLPVIYVIENNRYGMGTSVERASAGKELWQRGQAYEIPGEQLDGMDVCAVNNAAVTALDYVRSGGGPYILEMQTYRYRGHSMSDPAAYRSKTEVQKIRTEKDPLDSLKLILVKNGYDTESNLKDYDKEIREMINEAADFAQESPEPSPSELYTDVLSE